MAGMTGGYKDRASGVELGLRLARAGLILSQIKPTTPKHATFIDDYVFYSFRWDLLNTDQAFVQALNTEAVRRAACVQLFF